ncbi:hypothetical protein E3U43_007927 [Larimichthys crocea]|uniref:Uncharacterized protein n=1 Tax=Larimichthys crocea TaxID=215358 RepID=A0ACD3Q5X0_LARCR|nr:hypothetical protein E3U43_007927 [Larimichthys crocea]
MGLTINTSCQFNSVKKFPLSSSAISKLGMVVTRLERGWRDDDVGKKQKVRDKYGLAGLKKAKKKKEAGFDLIFFFYVGLMCCFKARWCYFMNKHHNVIFEPQNYKESCRELKL